MAAALTGCMTDGSGHSCAWLPNNDGTCDSSSSSSGSGPNIHSDISPVGVSVGETLHVAMTGRDNAGTTIEMTTLSGMQAAPVVPVLDEGAPIHGIVPQLQSIDGRVYMVATVSSDGSMGGVLLDDGTLDASTDASFAASVGLYRVGARYLVVPTKVPDGGVVRGTWVASDGTVVDTVDIAPNASAGDETTYASNDADGTVGLWALAYFRDVGTERELRVARMTADGVVLDGEGLLIASPNNEVSPTDVRIAVLADGTVWLSYQLYVSPTNEMHVVRIARGATPTDSGTITDTVTPELPLCSQVIAHGDRILGVSHKTEPDRYVLHIFDGFGKVLADPMELPGNAASVFTTPAGFAVLADTNDVSVLQVADDGTAGSVASLASAYEIDSGCNAGGSNAPWLGLAAVALMRRRRRGQRARRSIQ